MDNDQNITVNSEPSAKKKQKAGLNAVRPTDYVEMKFKDMASEKKLSQTEMFERMFWNFIKKEREEKQNQAIDYTSEINLISKDLNNILNHFKGITEKAQESIISLTNNSEQAKKNMTLQIDTLNKKNEELESRNIELEKSNKVFYDVKTSLENTINNHIDEIKAKDFQLIEVDKVLKEKEDNIKKLEKIIKDLEKTDEKQQKEIDKLSTELNNTDSKVKTLEITNANLQSTLSNIDTLKKSEIAAIESKYQAIINNLENKISNFEEIKEKEIKSLENKIKTELETDKKMAIADMKLEMVEIKSKYTELQAKYNLKKQK